MINRYLLMNKCNNIHNILSRTVSHEICEVEIILEKFHVIFSRETKNSAGEKLVGKLKSHYR